MNGKLSLREYSTQDAVSMRSLPQEGVVVKVQIGDQLPQSIKRAPGVNLLAATKPSGSTFSIEVIWKYGISSDVSAEKATYLSGILVGTVRDKAIIATVFPPDLSDDTESIKSIFISQRGLQRRARIVVERHPENVFLLECDLPGYPYGLVGPQLALHQQIAFRDKSPGSAMRSQDPRYLTTEESNNLLCGEPVFQTQSNQLIAIMGMRPSSDRESIGELKSDGTLIPVATIRDLLHSYMQSQVSGKAVYSEMHGGRIGLIPKETYGEWLIGGQAFVVSRKTSLERESRMVFPDKKVRPDAFKVGVVVDVEYHTQNGIQYADEIEIQKK